MAKPLVAIVGRPNVGKSMLFNKLTGQRTSIVEDTPGVTRDRIYGDCEWCNRHFSLVDTGGIEPGTENDMLKFMRRQAEIGIELADCVVMVVDVKSGMTAADEEVAVMLRKSGKPVALAVNKCDSVGPTNPEVYEFYGLGIGDLFEVSAIHGHGTGDLLVAGDDQIYDYRAHKYTAYAELLKNYYYNDALQKMYNMSEEIRQIVEKYFNELWTGEEEN